MDVVLKRLSRQRSYSAVGEIKVGSGAKVMEDGERVATASITCQLCSYIYVVDIVCSPRQVAAERTPIDASRCDTL